MEKPSNTSSQLKNRKKLSEKEVGILLFLAGLLLGAYFRLVIPATSDFPIGDGGLFYKMIQTIQQNDYAIPAFISFNELTIPFAYPPLAFYLVGLISDLTTLPLIDVLRWFPAFILVFTLPAFYFMVNRLLRSPIKAGLAVLMLAMLPRSILWFIKGGGITRSLGQLFLILAVTYLFQLFQTRERKFLFPSILLSALVCLTHPEAAIHTVGFGFILWLFYGRNKEGIFHAIAIGAGTFILTSIWWLPTVLNHGLTPFFHAAQTGFSNKEFLVFLFLSFSSEPFLPLITFFAIIGIAVQIAKREFLLPVLYIFPFILEPRNATNVSILPLAILAAIALADLIFPALSRFVTSADPPEFLKTSTEKVFFSYFIISLMVGMGYFTITLRADRVTKEHRDAFEWIRANVPPEDSSFILITNTPAALSDPLNEWFPVLTDRKSLTTIQGHEWLNTIDFEEMIIFLEDLQLCEGINCIETSMQEMNTQYHYIYISEPDTRLAYELLQSAHYQLEYEANSIMIFKKK